MAYFRTSSATNVGADKDSLKRQQAAVKAFAKGTGYELGRRVLRRGEGPRSALRSKLAGRRKFSGAGTARLFATPLRGRPSSAGKPLIWLA